MGNDEYRRPRSNPKRFVLTAVAAALSISGCATHKVSTRTPATSDPAHAGGLTERTASTSARPPDSSPSAAAAPKPAAPSSAAGDGRRPAATESGYEPPTQGRAAATGAPPLTPADHPASPAADVRQAQNPPPGLPEGTDTPAEPPHVFESDARGETRPDETVAIGSRAADDRPLDPSHLCDQRPAENEPTIDHTRRRVEEIVCTASMWFDGLFGDRYYLNRSRRSYGTVELSDNWSQFYGNKTRLRFDAQVELPNINRHLSAFIGRDNENDFIQDRFDNTALRNNFPYVEDHDKVFAGLGYSLPSSDRLHTSVRAGVRGLAHAEAFVQGRAQLNAYADRNDLINLRATPFWTTSDLLGVTVGADYSHVLNEKMLLRFGNVGTWAQTTAGLNWRSTLSVYQALFNIRSGLAYEVFVRGETDDDVKIHEYGVQTTFRHPIFRGKLYLEWVLGYSFPREDLDDHREGSILAGTAIQMPFGQRRK
jgi:hypothetical protein